MSKVLCFKNHPTRGQAAMNSQEQPLREWIEDYRNKSLAAKNANIVNDLTDEASRNLEMYITQIELEARRYGEHMFQQLINEVGYEKAKAISEGVDAELKKMRGE